MAEEGSKKKNEASDGEVEAILSVKEKLMAEVEQLKFKKRILEEEV